MADLDDNQDLEEGNIEGEESGALQSICEEEHDHDLKRTNDVATENALFDMGSGEMRQVDDGITQVQVNSDVSPT